jgi:hypothetical protein
MKIDLRFESFGAQTSLVRPCFKRQFTTCEAGLNRSVYNLCRCSGVEFAPPPRNYQWKFDVYQTTTTTTLFDGTRTTLDFSAKSTDTAAADGSDIPIVCHFVSLTSERLNEWRRRRTQSRPTPLSQIKSTDCRGVLLTVLSRTPMDDPLPPLRNVQPAAAAEYVTDVGGKRTRRKRRRMGGATGCGRGQVGRKLTPGSLPANRLSADR